MEGEDQTEDRRAETAPKPAKYQSQRSTEASRLRRAEEASKPTVSELRKQIRGATGPKRQLGDRVAVPVARRQSPAPLVDLGDWPGPAEGPELSFGYTVRGGARTGILVYR